MNPVRAEVIPFGEGHLLVSEAGVFALAEEARRAEALGREAYAHLGLPVVPLVVGSHREGYHQGVMHVADLEAYLQGLPRVLSPEEVERLAAFLKGEGARPEVRFGGGVVAGGGDRVGRVLATKEAALGPRVAKTTPPRPSPLPLLAVPPVLYAAFAGGLVGVAGLVPALWFVGLQDRLLREGGSQEEYAVGFSLVFQGLALSALLGAFGPGLLHGLGAGLAWALLPALYGVLARYWALPMGDAARLYALAWGDAFWWLPPVGLLLSVASGPGLEGLTEPFPMALVGLGVLALFRGGLLERQS
jgi:hypothetical protein